jgi:signal transduction histidine kinase
VRARARRPAPAAGCRAGCAVSDTRTPSDRLKHRIVWDVPDALPQLAAAVEVAAYHITLEALTNVARHADAKRCTVRVRHDGMVLCVEVIDDGQGIPADHRIGVGLSSMRERAAELGGSCSVAPSPARGTILRAVLPSAAPAIAAPQQGA